MTFRITWAQVSALLRSLPAIRFALMLGGGMVSTAMAACVIAALVWAPWPDAAAVERVRWLGIALAACLAVNGIIMLALAWGKAGSLKMTLPGGTGAEIDFDDDDDSKPPVGGGL